MFNKILLSAISFFLALIIVEALLSFLDIHPPRPFYHDREFKTELSKHFVVDNEVGWTMIPNSKFHFTTENRHITYYSNEKGYRVSQDYNVLNKNDATKVLVLGDSYMWGYGIEYENTFGGILNKSKEKLDVTNLAMPGFGVDQMYLSLIHWGLYEKPDLIVLGIHTDDFFRGFTNHTLFFKPVFKNVNGKLILKSPLEKPSSIYRFIEVKSRIFDLYKDGDEWLGRNYGLGSWWNFNKLILGEIIQTCELNNIPLLVIHIPYYTGNSFPVLQEYLYDKNIDYLDINRAAKGDLDNLYLKKDKHLNESGHKLMADYALNWIDKQKYITNN